MVDDKQTKSTTSSTDGYGALKELNGVKKLKSLDIDSSSGFVCDVNTGICGPIKPKEEDKK
ncbi:hypothetical protein DZB84_01700 [Bacillus sp. HNG]|uniref:hypothetical protein n=1 Tax=unclassified Bacillus (in: firmicutes) TaxID=185979 RepID=UPI000E2FC05F|nr:hypothetical protein [Bacillus sp. HNG]RFB18991.1 hypothetical protein DZB84_01700 [Bacillus sp. HNG]